MSGITVIQHSENLLLKNFLVQTSQLKQYMFEETSCFHLLFRLIVLFIAIQNIH